MWGTKKDQRKSGSYKKQEVSCNAKRQRIFSGIKTQTRKSALQVIEVTVHQRTSKNSKNETKWPTIRASDKNHSTLRTINNKTK